MMPVGMAFVSDEKVSQNFGQTLNRLEIISFFIHIIRLSRFICI